MTKLDLKKSVPIYRKRLSNGLDVVIAESHKVPVVCLNLAYRVGSKDELPGKTGLAHLFEHLMFEGSANVPKGEFDKLCSSAGGTNNAYTTYDLTSYNMSIPSFRIELGLWLESDRMASFAVTEDALATQRKVVVEEIKQTVEEQPYGIWREMLVSSAFAPECSYSWEVHGNKDHVAASGITDVKDIFDNFYQPNNACLVLAGDIAHKDGFALVEKYFGDIKNITGKKRRNIFKKEYLLGGSHVHFTDNVPMPAVFIAFHCPGFTDDEIFNADIISNVCGSGRSSRIYNSLVYEKQVASMAGSFVDKREHTSLVTFYAIANDPMISADTLYNELINVIDNIKSNGITEKEFNKSINQLTMQLANEIQYSHGIADSIAFQSIFWDDPERFYKLLNAYKALKRNEIKKFANNYLEVSNSTRVDALPK